MTHQEIQLTSDESGHYIHHSQVFSPDNKWIVFDGRNSDGEIMTTTAISMVNIVTGEIKELYIADPSTPFGPGVGAATFSPVTDRVLFLHGIRNASQHQPYSFTRRTGIAVDTDRPGIPVFMDARDITAPFTNGALRGGTHSHAWSGDGSWISFTYNDYIIEQLSKTNPAIKDLRTVGVMSPAVKVEVTDDGSMENNSGEMFAAIVTQVTENPGHGTDEIEKAFDECWIGSNGYRKDNGAWQKRAIAFQGHVRNENGEVQTEVFVVDIPDDITGFDPRQPLEGTTSTRPGIPIGVTQRRVTFMKHGVQGPRHWLRTTSDGSLIAFLAKDSSGIIQVFAVSPNGGAIRQLTYSAFSVEGQFNISPDDKKIAYVADNSIYVSDLSTGKQEKISLRFDDSEKPVGAVVWSNDGNSIAYNRYIKSKTGRSLQIFIVKLQSKK